MTTVRDAIAETGLLQEGRGQIVLAHIAPKRGPKHFYLHEIEHDDVTAWNDLYVASGVFREGAIVGNEGRSAENVTSILSLPFDADLLDYFGLDKKNIDHQDEILGMAQDEIDLAVRDLRTTLTETFADLGIPIHRLDYSGHGLCAHIYLRDIATDDVAEVKRIYKALVERVNTHAGITLVDPAVSDAGTRVTRIPGTANTKGITPRRVQTIDATWRLAPRLTLAHLRQLVGELPAARPATPIASATATAPDTLMAEIEAAIAPYWVKGHKHVIALAYAGMLCKARINEEQAIASVTRLSANDEKPWDRVNGVRSTYARAAAGQNVQGFTAMREFIDADALHFIDDRLSRVRNAAQGERPRLIRGGQDARPRDDSSHDDAEPTQRAKARYEVPPKKAFYGWFGAYRDLMAPTTEAPDCFHLGASLTLAGAMVGRNISTIYAGDQLYPNLYTLLIGASGSSRKDTAIKRALRLPQIASKHRHLSNPAFALRRDISSGEGLVAILKEEPNILLYISELTTMLRNIKRESTKSLGDKLIEAWDTPETLQNLNKQSPIYAIKPYLSIISGTQPGRLEEEMTDTEINSGFGNRWMFFAGTAKERIARPPSIDEQRASELYRELADAIRFYGEDEVLSLDPGASERWDAWYVRDGHEDDDEDKQAMRIRHATLIQKTALLFAISDSSRVITDTHLEAAIELIDWMWRIVQQLMPTWGSTMDRKIEERIIRILTQRGPMTRRDIQQATSNRRWSARDFASVFKAMQENQTIDVDAAGVVTMLGAAERRSA